MAWDSKSTRRRQNSTASSLSSSRGLSAHSRQQSRQVGIAQPPKSAHVADPFLRDFLSPAFDPAAYLNATLPPLQTSSSSSSRTTTTTATTQRQNAAAAAPLSLSDLSLEAQSVLSQLNAHTTRLTTTMTQLTDEILRSGGRLAYEVELLRGETLGLAEALTEGSLREDVDKFVPDGLDQAQERAAAVFTTTAAADGTLSSSAQQQRQRRLSVAVPPPAAVAAAVSGDTAAGGSEPPPAEHPTAAALAGPSDPTYISQLRALTLVRARLESVIKTFGEAMEFVFPPSEVSVTASFLSVSAPDPSSTSTSSWGGGGGGDGGGGEGPSSTEEKGQQVLKSLRDEIAAKLNSPADPIRGIEDAARRIEELKELARVWKGTAEEKGRARFIESLARMVEERHAALLREIDQQQQQTSKRGDGRVGQAEVGGSLSRKGEVAESESSESKGYGGYGLMSHLQKLRNGL